VTNGTYIHKEGLFSDLDFSDGAYIQFTIGNMGDYSSALFVTVRNPDTKKYYIGLFSDDLYFNTYYYFDTVPDIRLSKIFGYQPFIQFNYGTKTYLYYQFQYAGNFQTYNYDIYLPITVDNYRSIKDSYGGFFNLMCLSATTNTIYINFNGYPYILPNQAINSKTQFIPIGNQTIYGQSMFVYLTDGTLHIVSIITNIGTFQSFSMNTGISRGLTGLHARLTGSNTSGTDFLIGLEYNTLYTINDTDAPNLLLNVYDPILDDVMYGINYESPNTSLVMHIDTLNYTPSPNPMTNESLTDPVFMTGSEGFTYSIITSGPVTTTGSYYFPPGKCLYTDIRNALNSNLPTGVNFGIANRTLITDPSVLTGSTISFVGGLEGIVGTSTIADLSVPFTSPFPLANKMSMAIIDAQGNAVLLETTGAPMPSPYETLTVTLTGNSLNTHWSGTYKVYFDEYHQAIFDNKYNFDTKYGTAPYGTISFAYTDPISRNLSLPTRIIITAPLDAMRASGTTTISFAVSDTIMDLIKFSNLERRMIRIEQMTMNYSTDVGLNNPIGIQLLCPEFINTYTYDQLQNVDHPIIFSQNYQNPMYYFADSFTMTNGYVLPVTIQTNTVVHFVVKHALSDGSVVDAPLDNLTVFKFTLCAYVT
jgi:hypothetical protein